MKRKVLLFIILMISYINVYASSFDNFNNFFNDNVISPLRIIAVILFIVMSALDYSKSIYDKEASVKKANGRFVKRFVALMLIFFSNHIISIITAIL